MESLTETTQKITQLVDDIKIAINNKGGNIGECTPLSAYANEIENLPVQTEEVYSGTFIVFKESEVNPDSPEGGRWTGSEFEYPEGWSPKQQLKRTYSNTSTNTWMSYAIITKDSDETITWSVPTKISGENGLSDRIGVKNYNEQLYWTINDEYLLDSFGNKIKVSGNDGNDGKDAPSSLTSFVFTRYASEPNIPTGGSYSNPVPDNTDFIWTNNIPAGNDLIWISSRIFTSDGNYPQQSEWTHPTQLSDTVDLDIEYSEIENPNPPEGHPNTNIEWSNDPSDLSIWMAISKKHGSEWSDWKISKIKGDSGEKGDSGDKAPIIYSAGIWELGKSYDATPDKIPYVYFTGTESYWLLDQSVGENYTSTLDPEEDNNWKPFTSFEAVYSDIGLFKQALVGKWVFHGNYMFSQEGMLNYYIDENDVSYEIIIPSGIITRSGEVCNYSKLIDGSIQVDNSSDITQSLRRKTLYQYIESGIWTPNICFNAVTGEGWFSGKKIEFNADGSGQLGNGIVKWNSDYALITEKNITKYIYGPVNEINSTDPEPVVNVIYIQPTGGDDVVGYNKSNEFVLNLDNYAFEGEILTISNLSEELVYLSEYAPGENTHYEFIIGGLRSYKDHDQITNKLQPQRAPYIIIQPYSEIKLRLYQNPNLYFSETGNYAQVISPVVPFYWKYANSYTNSSIFDKDIDDYLKNSSPIQTHEGKLTDSLHEVLALKNPGFTFIQVITDGNKIFMDGGDDRCTMSINLDEVNKQLTNYMSHTYINIESINNVNIYIDSENISEFRIQYYYKNTCLGEFEHSIQLS